MIKKTEYLDMTKKKLGITSDYALSKEIGVSRSAISNYRSNKSNFDDFVCFQIAEILKKDPIEIIANMNAEREQDDFKRDFWMEKVREYSRAYSFFGAAFTTSIILKGIDSIGLFGDAVREICILC